MTGYVGPGTGGGQPSQRRKDRSGEDRFQDQARRIRQPAVRGRETGTDESEVKEGDRKNGEGGRAFMVGSVAVSRLAAVGRTRALGCSRQARFPEARSPCD